MGSKRRMPWRLTALAGNRSGPLRPAFCVLLPAGRALVQGSGALVPGSGSRFTLFSFQLPAFGNPIFISPPHLPLAIIPLLSIILLTSTTTPISRQHRPGQRPAPFSPTV